jgi:hypothetical protein
MKQPKQTKWEKIKEVHEYLKLTMPFCALTCLAAYLIYFILTLPARMECSQYEFDTKIATKFSKNVCYVIYEDVWLTFDQYMKLTGQEPK